VCVCVRVQRVFAAHVWMDELRGSSDVAPVTPSVVAPPHAHTIMHTRPLLLPRQPHPSPSSAMLVTQAFPS
jgi:hypothetical protein